MEFNTEGGMFLLDLPDIGEEWSVLVPWEVASDNLTSAGTSAVPDEDALKHWLQDNEARFAHMAAARIDPDGNPAKEEDDPRVLTSEQLRHI